MVALSGQAHRRQERVNRRFRPEPRRPVAWALQASTAAWLTLLLVLTGCSHAHSADVLAKVNGKPVYARDVDVSYQEWLADNQKHPSHEQEEIVKLGILRSLIENEILMEQAKKLNLTASDEDVDAQVNEMKAPYTEEQFAKRLADNHLTLADLRKQIRQAKTTEKLFNKEINSKINITDADIATYYDVHKTDYDLAEPEYHLAQIVVTDFPAPQNAQGSVGNLQNSKATNDAEAKKKIDMLHNRLESGEDFGTLAANFSERPDNAASGGDMGFVTESQLKGDMAVYNAVQVLKPGQITPVLPLLDPQSGKPVGYAIYRLFDKEAAGQRAASDPRVQQAIRQQLRDTRSQLLKNAYLEILHDRARVDNYYAESIFKNGGQ